MILDRGNLELVEQERKRNSEIEISNAVFRRLQPMITRNRKRMKKLRLLNAAHKNMQIILNSEISNSTVHPPSLYPSLV